MATAQWYDWVATALTSRGQRLGPARTAEVEHAVLSAVAADPEAFRTPKAAQQARHLWAVSLHLDDLTRLQGRIAPSVEALVEGA